VENSKSELTSTLHLSSRENNTSPVGVLDDYLLSLSEQDRAVIATIQSSGGVKAMFLINRGESKGARFLITHEGATIGRSSSSGVFLDDVTVSRAHAVVEKKGTAFVLRDSGSLNGTYVNNESVSEISLKTGDQIQIGKFHLLFVCDHSKGK
jgi:hypothetical protein